MLEMLLRLSAFGYAAALFVFKQQSTMSLVIGSFSDTYTVRDLCRKLEGLQARFGGELEVVFKPRQNDGTERIVVSFSSTWRMSFSPDTFVRALRLFKSVTELWKMQTLYIIHSSAKA